MKHLTLGVLAHVDAGKTTLCERLLYNNGDIKDFGRVDKQESFLDYVPLERKRGITIFSKEAILSGEDMDITLLDTPGHVDFVWETLACMGVMDGALLVLDASDDSVSAHSMRLFKLLITNHIPTFVFFNKMDLSKSGKEEILKSLSFPDVVFSDFTDAGSEAFYENAALCDEGLLEYFLENGEIQDEDIGRLIYECKLVPVYFGTALSGDGVEPLYDGIKDYLQQKSEERDFVPYKIARDEKGNRLTYGRVFKGIKPKESIGEEKIEEIRRYNGKGYENLKEADSGMLVALRGPVDIKCEITGDGAYLPLSEYEMVLPNGTDMIVTMQSLEPLQEEQPILNIHIDKRRSGILFSPMGEVQMEVLRDILAERFSIPCEFKPAGVIYKESIVEAVEGVGHFEPLRHYAETHLIIEPNPGRGIEIQSLLETDALDKNWQSQILHTLRAWKVPGAAIGAEIADLKISLVAGKSHIKHTEGGDFREATLRALRQGLMKAEPVILEPLYRMEIVISSDLVGKVMARLETMEASWDAPEVIGGNGSLTGIKGSFPASKLGDFPVFVTSISSGRADLSLEFGGYRPVENPESIILEYGYDPERDTDFPADSVFTSHGGSVTIPWYEVENYMHLPLVLGSEGSDVEELSLLEGNSGSEERFIGTEEIDKIIGSAGGSNKRKTQKDRRSHWNRYQKSDSLFDGASLETLRNAPRVPAKPVNLDGDDYLLVDGYNIIFSWENLKELADTNIDSARDLLTDILSEYGVYSGKIVILVFDAYKVAGGVQRIYKQKGIDIVFTKEAETADAYIEKTSHNIAKKHRVSVATSDRLEQIIVRGDGATVMSAQGLLDEINRAKAEIIEIGKIKD